mmetsp:Transcript_15175/g.43178  ORF Transcript_15175/g.43178 Transcript_15175/m.43178 type:complete len:261 (-) Transcript_15175:736-1518(-)
MACEHGKEDPAVNAVPLLGYILREHPLPIEDVRSILSTLVLELIPQVSGQGVQAFVVLATQRVKVLKPLLLQVDHCHGPVDATLVHRNDDLVYIQDAGSTLTNRLQARGHRPSSHSVVVVRPVVLVELGQEERGEEVALWKLGCVLPPVDLRVPILEKPHIEVDCLVVEPVARREALEISACQLDLRGLVPQHGLVGRLAREFKELCTFRIRYFGQNEPALVWVDIRSFGLKAHRPDPADAAFDLIELGLPPFGHVRAVQ